MKRYCSLLILVAVLMATGSVRAQNMPHEAGLLFASGGQASFNTVNEDNPGFYQSPTIFHLYYNFLTNGVQSLAIFLDRAVESRTRTGSWTDLLLNGENNTYRAEMKESLPMTTLGLETMRTLATVGDLRIAGGLGLSFGFGTPSIRVRNLERDTTIEYQSFDPWSALMLQAAVRARYTLYTASNYEVAIIALGRYWGYPYMGPIGTATDTYNGPGLRALNQFGYLAGVAIGF